MQLRITGVVGFLNYVRRSLQAGIPREEADSFKQRVRDFLQQVEAICREHRATPEQLPAPSRNAYRFLKNLDLDRLPLVEAGAPAPANPTFYLVNVVSSGESLALQLWREADAILASPAQRQEMLQEIRERIRNLEELCAQNGGAPRNMAAPSQQVYCWMKFLAGEENFTAHLQTLLRVRRVVRSLFGSLKKPTLDVLLVNIRVLYRIRPYQDRAVLKCNEAFLYAGEDVWRNIVLSALQRKRRLPEVVNDFALSEDFSGVLFEMESFIEPPLEALKGHVHDLEASFERVNRRYFQGKMARPALQWNRLLTVATMGYYQALHDRVIISLSLDHAGVPEFVLDYVMYHELLHKKHGETRANGRRFVHTPEFRREERQFDKYPEATAFLKDWALKQRGIAGEEKQSAAVPHPAGGSSPKSKSGRKRKKKSRKMRRR